MKLYLIWQNDNNDYDTYDSAVVVAESEEDAKTIHPYNKEPVTEVNEGYSSWTTINNVNVKYIGEAAENQKRGVICASFNAG